MLGGRKALGPLGSGGTRPGPAPPARPRHPLPGQLWAAPRGRGLGLGASSCLCVRLSVRLSEALAQLTIHQRVKRDRREASSLFRRLGAQQELLKDNTAPGTIPRVRQGCPTGAQTPGPSAGGPRPSGRPRGGERRSRAEACRGAAIGASARREVVVPSPQESRLSEPFQSAHNKCARHRMHHLPPQIRALMGRQIAVCGGHSGAWCRAACLPASGTRV
ncbi:uncharacterized protein LOC132375362 [Balaenoptera ricei]|uniref:uncharacterized protein LOC132375362 n=1 Tax=Balaenoptera ricei TaxID=2746895 RepID=UPI0028BF057E|nr:uncharacterized protein LOC132375362 [Balaenoptera ricei]